LRKEIERLRADNAKLKAALGRITSGDHPPTI
jgi:hypothetical protein